MLTTEEYKSMKGVARCPYGRDTVVGAVRCINCYFNKLDSDACTGDEKSVRRHMRRLGLDY